MPDTMTSDAPRETSATAQPPSQAPDQPPANGDALPITDTPPMVDDATRATSSITGQVRHNLVAALDDRKRDAADLIEKLARSVHRSGEQFEGQDWIAGAVQRGAAELDDLAKGLRDRDIAGLAAQARSFAGRQPALFAGAAFAAGFAIARLGKVAASDLSRDDLPSMPEVGHG